MSEKQGIEIDYCPNCRGIWLDRGELDKIIERSTSPSGGVTNSAYEENPGFEKRYPKESHYSDQERHRRPYKKKESFLSDLFDF
uniref:TFIIB-type zinc ribbon-containing protein n=1 Tax=Algoriphagus resistens TaxID=1750590 RepID=UPI000B309D21